MNDSGTETDLTAGGGGGSGTINSGIANSFAVYAADGTTLSDSIFSGSEPDGSLTYDLSSFPKFRLFREDGDTKGTNGLGVIEFGNTEFSSDRSSANAHIQVVGGGLDQDSSSNGGCIMNFKTLKNSETGTPQTRLKITAAGVVDSKGPFNAVHINTSMTTEGNPGTTRTINMTEDTHQYIGQVVDGGIVAFELPSSPDIGDTFRIVWETRNAFGGGGGNNSIVKITRASSSIQINGSTSDLTLKSNSTVNTFRGIAEVVCIDDGTGMAGAVAYVVQNSEV